jgi:hypothetical protein
MEEDLLMEIHYLCVEHQDHRPSGLVYVNEKGLRAVSSKLGFDHKKLTPKQRKQFVSDCRDCSQGEFKKIKTYADYLLI